MQFEIFETIFEERKEPAEMNYRIYLIINKEVREYRTFERIRDAIFSINPDAKVKITQMLAPCEEVIAFNPDIIMTYPFKAKGQSDKFYRIKKQTNCKIITFRDEGYIAEEVREQVKDYYIGIANYNDSLVDYELYWGGRMKEIIAAHLVKRGRLRSLDRALVLGYPKYEFFNKNLENPYQDESLWEESLEAKIAQYEKQNTLLFLTGFQFADYSMEDLYTAGDIDAEKDFENLEIFRQDCILLRREWIENILRCARANRDYLFIVKKHPIEIDMEKTKGITPYEALSGEDNIIQIRNEVSTMQLLQKSALLFHYGSTVVGESFLAKVPAVMLKCRSIDEDSVWLNGFYFNDDPSYMERFVDELPTIIKEYRKENFVFEENSSIKQFLKDIYNIDNVESYNPSRDIAEFLLNVNDALPLHYNKMIWLKNFLYVHDNFSIKYCYRRIKKIIKNIFRDKYGSSEIHNQVETRVNAAALDYSEIEKLIAGGTGVILISLKGITREAYSEYRKGEKISMEIENLKAAKQLNVKYGNKVTLRPEFTVAGEDEMKLSLELCESLNLKPEFKFTSHPERLLN